MKINRRKFLAGAGATAVGAATLGGYMIRSERRRHRPNVIVFIADDMRSDAAGFMGNKIVKTPVLDELAASSYVFENNFVTTSVCPISRASIMSGDYAVRHRVYDFYTAMRPSSLEHSFPQMMHNTNYYTGYVGKWGVGGKLPTELFNFWNGYFDLENYYPHKNQPHLTDITTTQALHFLQTAPRDKPFMLIVGYKAPHEPMQPQARFMDMYVKDTIPRADSDRRNASQSIPKLLKMSFDREKYTAADYNSDAKFQESMRNYYRLISGMDESIGAILKKIKEDNRYDDTSVIFTSDNGLLEGEHGLEGKWCIYEESIRVPLVVRPSPKYFPGYTSGRIDAISLNIDIAPTIIEMASMKPSRHIQGLSLLPLLTAADAPWREGFYYEHPGWDKQNIVACEGFRGTRWKYVHYKKGKMEEECLYDLTEDPHELTNLASEEAHNYTMQYMRELTHKERKYIIEM